MTSPGIAQLPGFADSLRLLIESHQYSMTDVAMMFNVSRERIRQLCAVHNIQNATPRTVLRTGLYAIRVWDDSSHQFRPIARSTVVSRARSTVKAANIATRQRQRTQRRDHVAACYRALCSELGSPPTLVQWVSRIRGKPTPQHYAGPWLVNHWGRDGGPVRGTLARIRTTVGAPPGNTWRDHRILP